MRLAPSATLFDDPGTVPASAAPARGSGVLRGEILKGRAALEALGHEWRQLCAATPSSVFQSPAFVDIWARHFTADAPERLWCVTVRLDGELALLWPIEICRCEPLPLRIASNAGAPIAQYDEVLIGAKGDPRALIATAIQTMHAAGVDLLVLERVRADSHLGGHLPTCAIRLGEADVAPFTETDPARLAAFLKGRKAKLRRDNARRKSALAEIGELRLDQPRDAATARRWLDETMALKRQWLREKGMVSRAFLDGRTHACLDSLAQDLADADGPLRLALPRLTVGDAFAAQEVGLVHNGIYHAFLRAFSPEFARHGPGNVLTEMILGWCAENGIARYDMLPPSYRNKREWRSGEVEVADYAVPLSATGRLYRSAVISFLKPRLRDLYYALPHGMRSWLAERTLRL